MSYNEDEYLMISGIQHFSFCRRQWALIHIEQQWGENYLTAEGRVIHERVHNTDLNEMRNGVLTCRGMAVKSSRLGITGNCDVVEFIRADNGITLFGREGQWLVRPVEYKHGSSKISDCDRLQLTAQAICLEEMFSCRISEGDLFYHETRRREKVEIDSSLRQTVEAMLLEMHSLWDRGYTPRVKGGKNCKNCSLADICLPILEQRTSVSSYIRQALEDDTL